MCNKTDMARDIILSASTIKREAIQNGLKDNRVVYDECQYIADMAESLIESIEGTEVRS